MLHHKFAGFKGKSNGTQQRKDAHYLQQQAHVTAVVAPACRHLLTVLLQHVLADTEAVQGAASRTRHDIHHPSSCNFTPGLWKGMTGNQLHTPADTELPLAQPPYTDWVANTWQANSQHMPTWADGHSPAFQPPGFETSLRHHHATRSGVMRLATQLCWCPTGPASMATKA